VTRNAAQRRSWTFYEAIKLLSSNGRSVTATYSSSKKIEKINLAGFKIFVNKLLLCFSVHILPLMCHFKMLMI